MIDDDPELARMVAESNAKIEAEGGEKPKDPAAAKSKSEAKLMEKQAAQVEAADREEQLEDPPSDMDLSEDLARLDELEDVPEQIGKPEIKPCTTLVEFRDAIALANIHKLSSIEASKQIIWHYTKPHYPKNGFFYYQNIQVIETGKRDEVERLMNVTTEEINFRGAPRP